jgi:hypothetical protein
MSLVTETWLSNNSVRRCILARVQMYDVVAGVDKYVYLSNAPYITTTSDVQFSPIISGGLQFSESITKEGSSSTSYGDLELNNPNGDLDSWLDDTTYIWVNRTIQLYYGDPTWVTSNFTGITTDFELVFDGIVVDVAARTRNKVNIKVRDKMEALNTPVTETKLGVYGSWGASAQPNADSIIPIVFGEVHNITPMLIDPSAAGGEYYASNGPVELLIEVRDNGIPVHISGSVTGVDSTNLATLGKFKLNASPAGAITISVQGVKNSINLATGALVSGTYANNVANLIALISTQYGKSYTKLVAADLDLTNLTAFQTANTQPVGIIVNDTTTVKNICSTLAESIGAQLFFTRKGKLQLIKFGIDTSDPSITITDRDILQQSLTMAEKIPVIAATKIAYCKNWTIQRDLTTGIPQSHKNMFSEEWMTITSTTDTTAIKDLYQLTEEPSQKNTMLIDYDSALAEANRLTGEYSTSRTIFTFMGTPRMQLLKLGQGVTLVHNRFGLSAGKTGQVIQLSPNWSTGFVNVGVLI